jgi:membrane protein
MNVPTLNSGLAPTRSRREKISQHVNDLLETLKNWPWLDTLRTLRQRFKEDHLGVTASSLTFTTLISLVPLVTVMLAVFSAFPMFASFQGALEKYFLQSLIPDSIAKPVLGALTQFANKSNRLGTAGLVALVVTALALMLTIDRTLNGIWRVRRPRPIAQRILVYWAALTLGPLLLGVSLSLTSYALTLSRGVVSVLPGGVSFLLNAIEFVLLACFVTCPIPMCAGAMPWQAVFLSPLVLSSPKGPWPGTSPRCRVTPLCMGRWPPCRYFSFGFTSAG